ncbi:MAG: hypothetical protein MAG715_01190 [Methanonatronarchaeales archaeon]|nr:hypothetical protein [Methanonatronarchaeales archaeon]
MTGSDGAWSIESVDRVESDVHGAPPSKEEVEGLLPHGWPSNWVELERSSGDGYARVTVAHPNPDPGGPDTAFNPETNSTTSKYDFVESLVVQGHTNGTIAKQNFENYGDLPAQGPGAPIPGAPGGLTVGEALETFAPGELSEEVETILEDLPAELEEEGIEFFEGNTSEEPRCSRRERTGRSLRRC